MTKIFGKKWSKNPLTLHVVISTFQNQGWDNIPQKEKTKEHKNNIFLSRKLWEKKHSLKKPFFLILQSTKIATVTEKHYEHFC